MTINNENIEFFKKLSKIWQNFKDYSYLEGIELSPEQISIIEQEEDQLLIEGYAGTGKSLTLLYKFINILVREEGKRIIFVTFNDTLIQDTKKKLNTSVEFRENKDRHHVTIATFHEMSTDILKRLKIIESGVGKLTVDKVNQYRSTAITHIAGIVARYKELTSNAYKMLPKEERLYSTHTNDFIRDEIAWMKSTGIITKEDYFTKERTGRSQSIRLTKNQRKTIFKIFEEYQHDMITKYKNLLDLEDYALKFIENRNLLTDEIKYDYIFVDEVQDLDLMQLKALCLLTKKSIVISGDAKQRIYKKSPIKYEDIGLKIREKGKKRILRKNFRSTAQIVKLANSIDFYDNEEDKLMERLFVKEGDRPIIHRSVDNKAAVKYIANEIKSIYEENKQKTIAVVHREEIKPKYGSKRSQFRNDLEIALFQSFTDIKNYGAKFKYDGTKQIFYTNAYDVKGLEFDVVFIVDFNSQYYPHQKEIDNIKAANEGKDADLINNDIIDFINREKKLLYVAMTRAKERLYIVANNCASERQMSSFVHDFDPNDYQNSNFTKKEIAKEKIHHTHMIKRLLVGNKKVSEDRSKQVDIIKEVREKEIDEWNAKEGIVVG